MESEIELDGAKVGPGSSRSHKWMLEVSLKQIKGAEEQEPIKFAASSEKVLIDLLQLMSLNF